MWILGGWGACPSLCRTKHLVHGRYSCICGRSACWDWSILVTLHIWLIVVCQSDWARLCFDNKHLFRGGTIDLAAVFTYTTRPRLVSRGAVPQSYKDLGWKVWSQHVFLWSSRQDKGIPVTNCTLAITAPFRSHMSLCSDFFSQSKSHSYNYLTNLF